VAVSAQDARISFVESHNFVGALLLALSLAVGLFLYALLIVAACKLVGCLWRRFFPPAPTAAPQVGRGSHHLMTSRNSREHPVALVFAWVAGIAGTGGMVLYCLGPFSFSPVFAVIGMMLAVAGVVTAGIIFGTDDRDYYI
jgi:hypothetical protein